MWLEVDIRQTFWIKSPPSHAGWVASHEIPETSNYLILGYVGVIVEKEETLQKAQRTRELSSAYQSNLSLGHITSSNTYLDQISSSESQPSTNFKISTKHQHFD